jgi:DNA-binding NarL/FixJ family response regulator
MRRESGATPAQTKVGIQLALGKTKPEIADELGTQLSSVVDVTKKLYQNLDVHNSAELATGWAKDKTRRAKICGAPDKLLRRHLRRSTPSGCWSR